MHRQHTMMSAATPAAMAMAATIVILICVTMTMTTATTDAFVYPYPTTIVAHYSHNSAERRTITTSTDGSTAARTRSRHDSRGLVGTPILRLPRQSGGVGRVLVGSCERRARSSLVSCAKSLGRRSANITRKNIEPQRSQSRKTTQTVGRHEET